MRDRDPVDMEREPGGAHALLPEVLVDVLSDSDGCLSLDQQTYLAEGTLPPAERDTVRAHLAGCPVCLSLHADVSRLFAPVRGLHQGAFGWQGPLLAAFGRLGHDPTLQESWSRHVERCDRCRNRVEAATHAVWTLTHPGEWVGASFLWLRRQLGGVALGFATALLLIAVRPAPLGVVPKTGSAGAPGVLAQDVLDRFLNPTTDELPYVLSYWETAAEESPDDPACLAKLKVLYLRQAEKETDPDARRGWREKERQVTERLRNMLSAQSARKEGTPQ